MIDAYRQAGVRAVDGASAAFDVSPLRGTLRGEHKVKSFSCLDQYLSMAFAQLTYRESLRDIEACLRAQGSKLYHLGIRSTVSRNTLANANATRDWRIYCEFAQRLIAIARRLYANEPFGVDLKDTVYALDCHHHRSVPVVVPVGAIPLDQSGDQAAHAARSARQYPSFMHISEGKLHEVNILDQLIPEPGAFYVMDRGYLDFARLHRFHDAGSFFVTRAKSNLKVQAPLLAPGRPQHGLDLRSDGHAHRLLLAQGLSDAPLRRFGSRIPRPARLWCS